MRLYRVFPYDHNARGDEPGGALFAPPNSTGRIANPSLFRELYLSDSPAGAVAEAFGRFDVWSHHVLDSVGGTPALATYELTDQEQLCTLDDAGRLLEFHLKPSDVVARDRRKTRAWATRIYEMKKWIGIAWWSRYDSAWQSMGIWDRASVAAVGKPEALSLDHVALREAAAALPRRIST